MGYRLYSNPNRLGTSVGARSRTVCEGFLDKMPRAAAGLAVDLVAERRKHVDWAADPLAPRAEPNERLIEELLKLVCINRDRALALPRHLFHTSVIATFSYKRS